MANNRIDIDIAARNAASKVLNTVRADSERLGASVLDLSSAGRTGKVTTRELADAVSWYDQRAGLAAKSTVQADSALKIIQTDIRRATADFRAGAISVTDYKTAMDVARQEALKLRDGVGGITDNQLPMFNSIMNQTAEKTNASIGGFSQLQRSLARVGLTAAGLPGPLGSIGSQLLRFSSGGLATLGITGGLLALVGLFRLLTAEARADSAAQKELLADLQKLGTHAQMTAAQIRLAQIEAQLADDGLIQRLKLLAQSIGKFTSVEEIRQRLEREKAELTNTLGKLGEEFTEPFRDALRDSNQALAESTIRFRMMGMSVNEIEAAVRKSRLAFDHYPPAIAATIDANEQLIRKQDFLSESYTRVNLDIEEAKLRWSLLGSSIKDVTEAVRVFQLTHEQGLTEGEAKFQARAERDAADLADPALGMGSILDQVGESVSGLRGEFDYLWTTIAEGGALSGAQLAKNLLSGLAAASGGKAIFYLAEGFAALAASVFPVPDPAKAAAAGFFFKAAAIHGAIAVGSGLGAAAFGRSLPNDGRGGSGGRAPSVREGRDKEEGVINVIGGLLDMSDPRQADALTAALEKLTGRRVVIKGA